MSPRGRARLKVVPDAPEPSPAEEAPTELGLYGETRRVARDHERWRKLHECGQRAPAINIAAQARRLFAMKGGVRRERGGFKFDERP